ncbi:hypothetical protein V6R21_28630 [Limibacter armeniacum]|uniref:hypothetical protein n=1 Tax=Limibacter armeniacum TaxID=466084 RepID=UPI002FE5F4DE
MITKYYMDFSFTDTLFEGDKKGYTEFLEISIDEFEIDFPKLKTALETKDPELFSAVKHKFSTRLNTFQLTSLEDFMQEITNNYKNDVHSVDAAMAIAELERHQRGIVEALKEKLTSVS